MLKCLFSDTKITKAPIIYKKSSIYGRSNVNGLKSNSINNKYMSILNKSRFFFRQRSISALRERNPIGLDKPTFQKLRVGDYKVQINGSLASMIVKKGLQTSPTQVFVQYSNGLPLRVCHNGKSIVIFEKLNRSVNVKDFLLLYQS